MEGVVGNEYFEKVRGTIELWKGPANPKILNFQVIMASKIIGKYKKQASIRLEYEGPY